jgi:hypothetical protein
MLFTTDYKPIEFQPGATTKDVAYLPAGIHENIILKDVRVDKSPKKSINFIEFTFADEHGNIVKSTEYEPTPKQGEDSLAYQRRVENFMRRVLQIVRIYTNENFGANSFAEMAA